MNSIPIGLIAALLAVSPAHAGLSRLGAPAPSMSVNLPYYPLPLTRIGGPAIQLPSPMSGLLPALPNPGLRPGGSIVTLPMPERVALIAPTHPLEDLIPTLPDVRPELPRPIPLGPQQLPRPKAPANDPMPAPVPLTLRSKMLQAVSVSRSANGRVEAAAARFAAAFDNAETPAQPSPVEVEESRPQPRAVEVQPERRITLPEWDLENEIGINSTDPGW